MADTNVYPVIGARLSVPSSAGNVVGAGAVAAQIPNAQSNTSAYNPTLGGVVDALRIAGGVVSGASAAGSFALQAEYAQTAKANQQAINNQVGQVNQAGAQFNQTADLSAGLTAYANVGSSVANNLATLNNQANAIKATTAALAGETSALNALRTSRDKATRDAANAQIKANYAAMQNNNALLTKIAADANKQIAAGMANDATMKALASANNLDPNNISNSLNNRIQADANNLKNQIGSLNQAAQNAQNDQKAYLNNQQIASYGQQSGAALDYLSQGVAQLGAGQLATGSGSLIAGALSYTPTFAPNLVPGQTLMQASAAIIAAGLESGNVAGAFNQATQMMGQAKYWDNVSVAINNFDAAAARNDMVGMAVTATSSFGNTLQALGNMTQALAGGFDPISAAIGGAASMSGVAMNLGAVGLVNLNSNAQAAEMFGAGAYNAVHTLTQAPIAGGGLDLLAATGMSLANLFNGTLGSPNNQTWRQGLADLVAGMARESGNLVRISPETTYSNSLGGLLAFANNPQMGITGMLALRSADLTPTSNIAGSAISGFPSYDLPMGGTNIPGGIGDFNWGPSPTPPTPGVGTVGAANMISNFLGASDNSGFGGGGSGTGGGGFGPGGGGFGPGGGGSGIGDGGSSTGGDGPGTGGPASGLIGFGGGGNCCGPSGPGPGPRPRPIPTTQSEAKEESPPEPPPPPPKDPFELPSTGVRGEDEPTTALPEEPPTDVLGVPEEPPTMVTIAEEPPTTNNPEEVPDTGEGTGTPPTPPPTPPPPTPPNPPLPPPPPAPEKSQKQKDWEDREARGEPMSNIDQRVGAQNGWGSYAGL